MKIGIIGYGKMGKAIEKVAIDRGHLISFKTNNCDLNLINDVDVTIEFSTPESAFTNIKNCIDSNVPVVSGTTGWLEDLDDIKKLCDKKNGSFLYASNFSLGANLFFELNKKLAHLMSDKNQYKTSIDETHHIHKVDKPSGTAITLADDIISNSRYKNWELDSSSKDKININSSREKEVNGVHKVVYSSENDIISIKHEALNRNGFALGAVISAEWLVNKKGCFSISDMLIIG
ncbi:MAG: 4-hydroxy-tetrahydrodipicolinate reductase [Flavobacteriaceae bacterium]|nr:4-hydroxy-tetrahydrodipicolinate reductase [Flavobacteriaceae bacterium]